LWNVTRSTRPARTSCAEAKESEFICKRSTALVPFSAMAEGAANELSAGALQLAAVSWPQDHGRIVIPRCLWSNWSARALLSSLRGAPNHRKSLHRTRTPAKDGTQGLLSEYLLFETFALMLRTWTRQPFSSSGRTMERPFNRGRRQTILARRHNRRGRSLAR
jgi:hypothetical protein